MNEGFDGSVEETKSTYKLSLKHEEEPKTEEKSDDSAVEKTVETTEKLSSDYAMNNEINNQIEMHNETFFYANPNPVVPEPVIKQKNFKVTPVMLLAAIVVILLGAIIVKEAFHKDNSRIEGYYSLVSSELNGMTITNNDLKARGFEPDEISLEINDDNAIFHIGDKTDDCSYEVDGSEMTFTMGKTTLYGEVNYTEKTVTVDVEGYYMTFEKDGEEDA